MAPVPAGPVGDPLRGGEGIRGANKTTAYNPDRGRLLDIVGIMPVRTLHRKHPAEKPGALVDFLLEAVPVGATILDPFCGSGTTLFSCKKAGRKAIGVEVEERYCEIAAKRMAQMVMSLEVPA